jgi:hypothetical protein
VIFGQGFLPVALDTPVSNCKAAVLVLVRPAYFTYFPGTCHIWWAFPYPPPREAPDGRLATPQMDAERRENIVQPAK